MSEEGRSKPPQLRLFSGPRDDMPPNQRRMLDDAIRLAGSFVPVASVPATRADCPVERPCPHVRCKHNLIRHDERAGRPHNGRGTPPGLAPMWLEPGSQSCALDVADANPDGVSSEAAGRMAQVTGERHNQVEDRALCKLSAAKAVEDWLDELRPKLPPGARIETVYPEQLDAHRTVIALVVRVDGKAWRQGVERAGVTVRRKR